MKSLAIKHQNLIHQNLLLKIEYDFMNQMCYEDRFMSKYKSERAKTY